MTSTSLSEDLLPFPADEKTCRLPHPLRAQLCLAPFLSALENIVGAREWGIVRSAFEDPNFLLSNLPQLIDQNRLVQFSRFFETAAHAPGSTELGGAMATMVGARHLVSPYRLFRVEDALVGLLGLTDMDADIPVSFLKLPFPRCFVELGQRRDLQAFVPNDVSGLHVLEGAYLEQGRHPSRGEGLYIMLTGSPLGKDNCMDDSTHAVFLSTDDPEMPLSEALDQAFASATEQSEAGGYTVPSRTDFKASLQNLQWLVKALLYIGLPDTRKTLQLERSELLKQIEGLRSPGKRSKAMRRLGKLCDTVLIHAPAISGAAPDAFSGEDSTRAAHWRRGHYRRQAHGPALSLRKLIFLAPMRVGGAEQLEALKTYVVR